MNRALLAVALVGLLSMMMPTNAETATPPSLFDANGVEPALDTLVEYVCTGTAPSTTNCSNGEHTRSAYMLHGPTAVGATFTGFIQSRVESSTVTRAWTCEYENGVWQPPCQGTGSWPPVGVQVTHKCRTFFNTPVAALNTALINAGVEGGDGDWGCRVVVDE